jgi:hypothetical protein
MPKYIHNINVEQINIKWKSTGQIANGLQGFGDQGILLSPDDLIVRKEAIEQFC